MASNIHWLLICYMASIGRCFIINMWGKPDWVSSVQSTRKAAYSIISVHHFLSASNATCMHKSLHDMAMQKPSAHAENSSPWSQIFLITEYHASHKLCTVNLCMLRTHFSCSADPLPLRASSFNVALSAENRMKKKWCKSLNLHNH